MENKYNRLILIYGVLPVIMVLKEKIELEDYSECAMIEQAFLYHEETYKCYVPREITEEVLEDYKCSFWKLGYSGEIALNNLADYVENVKTELRLSK